MMRRISILQSGRIKKLSRCRLIQNRFFVYLLWLCLESLALALGCKAKISLNSDANMLNFFYIDPILCQGLRSMVSRVASKNLI